MHMAGKRTATDGYLDYIADQENCLLRANNKECLRESGSCTVRDSQRVCLESSRKVLNWNVRRRSESDFCKTPVNFFKGEVMRLFVSVVTENMQLGCEIYHRARCWW